MPSEAYDIVVTERGADRAREAIASIANATDKTDASVKKLNNSFADSEKRMGSMQRTAQSVGSSFSSLAATLGVTFSTGKLIEYADSFTKIQNQLRRTNTDAAALGAATDKVYAISQKTGTSFEANATTYVKVQQALQRLNQDTSRAGPLLQTIAQAVQASGVSSQSAAAGLYQFTQGLNEGKLRGEDFNSVMEQIPGLASAIEVGISKMGVNSGMSLRQMAEQGLLSTDIIFKALEKVAPNVAASAARASTTVDQALQRLANSFTMYVGQNAREPINKLIAAIDLLSQNLDKVMPFVTAFGIGIAAWIAIKVVGWLAAVAYGLATLAVQTAIATVRAGAFAIAWAAANLPLLAIAGTAAAFGIALLAMTGHIDKAIEFGKTMKAEFDKLGKAIDDGAKKIATLEEEQKKLSGSLNNNKNAANDNANAINNVGGAAQFATGANQQLVSSFADLQARWAASAQAAQAAAQAYVQAGQAAAQAAAQIAAAANAANNSNMHASYYNAAYGGATAADVASQIAGGNGGGYRPNGYDPVVSGPGRPVLPQSSGGTSGFGPSVAQQIRNSQNNLYNQIHGPGSVSSQIRNSFASGGDLKVGGVAGHDANPVQFMATKGERVLIQNEMQQRREARFQDNSVSHLETIAEGITTLSHRAVAPGWDGHSSGTLNVPGRAYVGGVPTPGYGNQGFASQTSPMPGDPGWAGNWTSDIPGRLTPGMIANGYRDGSEVQYYASDGWNGGLMPTPVFSDAQGNFHRGYAQPLGGVGGGSSRSLPSNIMRYTPPQSENEIGTHYNPEEWRYPVDVNGNPLFGGNAINGFAVPQSTSYMNGPFTGGGNAMNGFAVGTNRDVWDVYSLPGTANEAPRNDWTFGGVNLGSTGRGNASSGWNGVWNSDDSGFQWGGTNGLVKPIMGYGLGGQLVDYSIGMSHEDIERLQKATPQPTNSARSAGQNSGINPTMSYGIGGMAVRTDITPSVSDINRQQANVGRVPTGSFGTAPSTAAGGGGYAGAAGKSPLEQDLGFIYDFDGQFKHRSTIGAAIPGGYGGSTSSMAYPGTTGWVPSWQMDAWGASAPAAVSGGVGGGVSQSRNSPMNDNGGWMPPANADLRWNVAGAGGGGVGGGGGYSNSLGGNAVSRVPVANQRDPYAIPDLPEYLRSNGPVQMSPNPQMRPQVVVNQTIVTKDYDSMRRNKTQLAQDTLRALRA